MSTGLEPLQTIDSGRLYHSALSLLSLPLPPAPSPLLPPPPTKLIPNTRFLVDSFRLPSSLSTTAFFLSHFHSDHYSGLSSSWSRGIIFCSPLTSSLLTQILKVPSPFVFPLPLRCPLLIDGSEVTLVDANHCPGAVQFLFKVPSNKDLSRFEMYVHTGDFRYNLEMKKDTILEQFVGCDAVFLDTTYCNPKFVFPKQEESVDYVLSVIDKAGRGKAEGLEKGVLFLVATYVVGKEKILLEIARRFNKKVVVDARKMEVLRVLGYGDRGVFTDNENESDVHVVGWNVLGETWPYFRPNFGKMKEIMVERGYSSVVGFVPTGWTYEVKRNKFSVKAKDSFQIHLVPYSEHSNYDELREYVKFLRPKHVIPTVGMDVENSDSKHVRKMQKHFAGLVDEMANKKEFLMSFCSGLSEKDDEVERNDVLGVKEVQDQKNELNSYQAEDSKSNDLVFNLNSSPVLQEPASENPDMPDDDQVEKIILELSNCLPTWVTRDQMLELISSSGTNIVELVSNFYERETEFHEQIFALNPMVFKSETRSKDDDELLSKAVSIKSDLGNLGFLSSQPSKSTTTKPSVKTGLSPGKRKRSIDSKHSKKMRSSPKSESGRSKQSTITNFFSKLRPDASQHVMLGSISEQCSIEEKLLPTSDMKLHRQEIERFIQIIDGDESSRTYAATILEKAKGDINKALDIHYGYPDTNVGETVEKLAVSGKLVHAHPHRNKRSSAMEKVLLDEPGDRIELPVQGSPNEVADVHLVSLPPEKYDPVKHACWTVGQPAPYVHLARTFEVVEAEKGRNKATSMLCNMFRSYASCSLLALSPDDVLPAVYLCTNKIAADHENMELNIGGSIVTSALEEACGTKRSKIRDMYNNLGDLGDVAQVCRQTQTLLAPCPPLLIKDVFSVLRKISVQSGNGSFIRKKNFIMNLMRSCQEKEMKFIVRTLVRNLRIGAMMRTILPALAQAVALNYYCSNELKSENLKDKLQSLSAAVVEAYNILPNLDLLVPSLINEGVGFSSSTLSMVPGIPIKPMLAKITNGVSQVLKILQNKSFTCEYKYDGQRAQIHKMHDGAIRVFSRNGDETTSKFPDLINIIQESCKSTAVTFIVDAEVVAVDIKNGCKLMSFQELSSRERGRKDSSIAVNDIKVDICVFVFDVMFANGEQLLACPLRHRRKYLKDLFCNERAGYLEYAKEMTVEAHDAHVTNKVMLTKINDFLQEAFHSSCEGLMVKSLDVDAGYTPSKRTDTWLKVKRDYVEGLGDSLDLVPIGAWHGNGRKAGWYSPFLMACYNPENENFQSVCRVMSGFSDAFYIEMKEFFSGDRILSKKPPYYETAEVPDLWFSPELVWEIRGADFTVSPVHQAAVGLVHPSRGISIRFPRFLRCVTDRKPEDCSTAADVADMFNSQTRKMDVTTGD